MDLVRDILAEQPHTAAIMVTGLDSPVLANAAIEVGAFGYIIKPFESNEVLINVANALRRRRLELENRFHRENLEDIVRTRTLALQQALDSLERSEKELRLSREETIQRLAIAAEFRDNSTARHIHRMSHYCELLARRCGLSPDRCDLIRTASPMHDIGKIGTPDLVLLKPGIDHIGKQKVLSEPFRLAVPKVCEQSLRDRPMPVEGRFRLASKDIAVAFVGKSGKNTVDLVLIGSNFRIGLQTRENQQGAFERNRRAISYVTQNGFFKVRGLQIHSGPYGLEWGTAVRHLGEVSSLQVHITVPRIEILLNLGSRKPQLALQYP